MLYSKSNAWYHWLLASIFAITLVASSTSSAQQIPQQPGQPGQPGQQPGQQPGRQGTGGSDLIDMPAEFIGDVDREGAVGEFTEPVGASTTSSAAGLSTGTGSRRAGGGFAGGGLGGLGGGLGAAFNDSLGATGDESVPPLRTRLRSAVELPPTNAYDQISREIAVNTRLQRTSTLGPRPRDRGLIAPGADDGSSSQPLYGVNVQMQGRTAILQGTVSSPADRRMSELLMRLEPGVSQVDNRISVAQ